MKLRYILTIKDFHRPVGKRTLFDMSVDSYSEVENLMIDAQEAIVYYGKEMESKMLDMKSCEMCGEELGMFEKRKGGICNLCKKKLREDELRYFSKFR